MNTELNPGEFHPMAPEAFQYVKGQGVAKLLGLAESLASTALSGNRTAEVCWGTLDRILRGQPVSDRYLLGLAWLIRSGEDGLEPAFEAQARELAKALRDAVSTFREDGAETRVTFERQEAWRAVLAEYDALMARPEAQG